MNRKEAEKINSAYEERVAKLDANTAKYSEIGRTSTELKAKAIVDTPKLDDSVRIVENFTAEWYANMLSALSLAKDHSSSCFDDRTRDAIDSITENLLDNIEKKYLPRLRKFNVTRRITEERDETETV